MTCLNKSGTNHIAQYMISYREATNGGIPEYIPQSETGNAAPMRELVTPSSPTLSKTYDRVPPSPTTLRRHAPRKSVEKNEARVPQFNLRLSQADVLEP